MQLPIFHKIHFFAREHYLLDFSISLSYKFMKKFHNLRIIVYKLILLIQYFIFFICDYEYIFKGIY